MWIGSDVALEDDDDLQFNESVEVLAPRSIPAALSGSTVGLRATFHLWCPLLLLLLLVLPHLTFLLPDTADRTDEVYQPLRALKFFKTYGQEFHKYGPMTNFVLAAPFGATLGYWWLNGEMSAPRETFPYGFHDPMRQMGTLILEARITVVLLGLIAFYFLAREIAQITRRRVAVALAMIFCIAGNAVVVWKLPVPEVDSPMLAFTALALAVYLRIARRGVTTKRLVWMFVFAVAAISSKEIAGPLFVLPTLAIGVMGWRGSKDDPARRRYFIKCCAVALATAIGLYMFLNVVYAPAVWAARMHHWLLGDGIDSEVWGVSSGWRRVIAIGTALLANLGPGGIIAISLSLITMLWLRPRYSLLLALPAIGLLVVVGQVGYVPSRFYTPIILSLAPWMALALDEFLERVPARQWFTIGLILLGGLNFWFATVTWVKMSHNSYYVAERYADENVRPGTKVAMLSTWGIAEGSTRLEEAGRKVETRPIQKWSRGREALPDIVFASKNKYQYLLDARKLPARGSMLKQESGFNASKWDGLEAMGYAEKARVKWKLPVWYPFRYLPLGDLAEPDLLVFHRLNAAPSHSSASTAN